MGNPIRQSGWLRSAIAGGVVLLGSGAISARADEERSNNQLVTCQATGANVADVSLNNLRMGVANTYFWATAKVRLLMRDGSNREYALNGRADPIDKQLRPNHAAPGFAYPGFACTVRHAAIASVRNCHGGNSRRTCEIGLQVFGVPMAYSVSLTAERLAVRKAGALQ